MGAQASREARRCGERPFPAPVFSDRVRTITLTGKDGNEIPLRVIERPVSLYNCQNLICTSKSLQDLFWSIRCRAPVGADFCACRLCLARSISRRRRHARNRCACTRCGDRRPRANPMWTGRIAIETSGSVSRQHRGSCSRTRRQNRSRRHSDADCAAPARPRNG